MVYIPLCKSDEACARLASDLAERGITMSRETDAIGRVFLSLTNSISGQVGHFRSPLNLWHDTPEATLALAAELAMRAKSASGDFDRWLRWTGYGVDREELRGAELRRARMEYDEAYQIISVFRDVIGVDWESLIAGALG